MKGKARSTIAAALAGSAVLAAGVLFEGAARSQPAAPTPDQSAAIALFNEAKALMDAKDFAAACPKLIASQKLAPALGTLLNIARCHEGEGKTASAWAGYREVAVFAEKAGQSERAGVARERAATLEAQLSRLRIDVDQPPPGLVVQRDGVAVEPALLGTAVAVDPGEHTVQASAPGFRSWSAKVTIGKAADQQVVHIPVLEKGSDAPPAPTTSVTAQPTSAPTALPAVSSANASTPPMRTAGFVLGGLGLAMIAAGAALGGVATASAKNLAEDPQLCPDKLCTNKGYSELQTTTALAWASTIGLAVGAVAVGTGALLVFRARGVSASGKAAVALEAAPVAGPSGAMIKLKGSF